MTYLVLLLLLICFVGHKCRSLKSSRGKHEWPCCRLNIKKEHLRRPKKRKYDKNNFGIQLQLYLLFHLLASILK